MLMWTHIQLSKIRKPSSPQNNELRNPKTNGTNYFNEDQFFPILCASTSAILTRDSHTFFNWLWIWPTFFTDLFLQSHFSDSFMNNGWRWWMNHPVDLTDLVTQFKWHALDSVIFFSFFSFCKLSDFLQRFLFKFPTFAESSSRISNRKIYLRVKTNYFKC